jgi:hypothetical protein
MDVLFQMCRGAQHILKSRNRASRLLFNELSKSRLRVYKIFSSQRMIL